MAQQKLYTKEMFLIAAEKCEVSMIDAKHIMKYIDEYVASIELPSDEESFEHLWEEPSTITPPDLMSNIIPSYPLHNYVKSSKTNAKTKCSVCGLELWQHYKIQ
jgi:hypothetical protein